MSRHQGLWKVTFLQSGGGQGRSWRYLGLWEVIRKLGRVALLLSGGLERSWRSCGFYSDLERCCRSWCFYSGLGVLGFTCLGGRLERCCRSWCFYSEVGVLGFTCLWLLKVLLLMFSVIVIVVT